MTEAYPEYFDDESMKGVKGLKVMQFRDHFESWPKDPLQIKDVPLLRADGYKYASEWWLGLKFAESCMQHLTGCEAHDDVACGDRHALQKLMMGPFRSKFTAEEESRILGVPKHVKHGILSLKHSLSPRFEVAVHLRTQFKHFGWLVGPKDDKWKDAEEELHSWLNSKDGDKGFAIFRAMEQKLLEVLDEELNIRYGGPPKISKTSSGALSEEERKDQVNIATRATVDKIAVPSASPTSPSTSPPTSPPSNVITSSYAPVKTASGGVTGSLWEMIWNDPSSVKRRQAVRPDPRVHSSSSTPATPSASPTGGSEPDYKKLYEETQMKIDNIDYKKLYEVTQSKIKELQIELGETPSSLKSSTDSSSLKNAGSEKRPVDPQSLTSDKKETLASSFITHSSYSPSSSGNFEELDFSERPYKSSSRRTRERRQLRSVQHPRHKRDADVLYVYVGSDNSVVKETFCEYLENSNYTFTINDGNISGVVYPVMLKLEVMRIVNEGGYIAHGKNIKNLKETTNNTGIVDLTLDWYAISLANHILSWRRDTHLISTFAQSAQRLSGNTESTNKNKILDEKGGKNTHYHGIGHGRGSRGHNMYFGRNHPFLPQWREYW